MSCTLYLVRHGIAEAAGSGGDAERRLTSEGVRKLRQVARGLKRLILKPDAIISSPLRRAEQTAAILCAVLAPGAVPQLCPLLAPGEGAEAVAAGLREHRRAHELVLVGHQPSLGQLASYLLARSPHVVELPFRKGGVAAIVVDSLPPRASGTLEWFVTAEQLRWMGRKGR